MIRYPVTEDRLRSEIETLYPTWPVRALERTANFITAGRYNEKKGVWSEIKPIYMGLQKYKCGFCEKWLETLEFGAIEHDVEHFRPKSRVRAYPPTTEDVRSDLRYTFSTGGDWETGYFELAYHPLNYLTSCKICNSTLKSDYFPVAAARIASARHPRDLVAEQPFLLYPIGDLDTDPETLIGFDGIIAVPVGTNLHDRRRAQVTIDFFQLNNRDDLRRQRAVVICNLHAALDSLPHLPEEKQRSTRKLINRQMLPSASHTNCSRCFVRLFQLNPARAADLVREAENLYPSTDDDPIKW